MIEFTLYSKTTGEVLRCGGLANDADIDVQVTSPDQGVVEGIFKQESYYFVGDVPTEYTPEQFAEKNRPFMLNIGKIWSNDTLSWQDIRTIDAVKNEKRAEINASRAVANATFFTYEGKQIAVDALSRSDIDAVQGMVLMTNAFPAGWPGGWKCMDNTYVAITTIEQWAAFYTAMVNQGTLNFGHAQTLKAQIDAATTIAEVEAVIW